jgi:ribose transport system ATP-binding protein
MPAAPLLEMRGICKRFPGIVALDSVVLRVAPGEVVALVGENGAGKSTLMRVLHGVYQPEAGEILVEGQAVEIKSVQQAIRLGIAFIHQELNTLDNLDIAANVFLGREPRNALGLIRQKKIHADTRPLLDQLGLKLSTRTRVGELSLAHKQLLEIAKALSLNARLIIMDEPTSSLTLSETDRLLQIVSELSRQGVSIIFISHRLAEIDRCAHRVVVLRDGRNAGDLRREEATHEKLISLMVGREIKRFYAEEPTAKTLGFFRVRKVCSRLYPTKSVSLDASAGEILGIAGLVGAGRSEMAKAVVGLDASPDKEIWIAGGRVEIDSPRHAISQGIYLVPENRRVEGLVLGMSVRENISLPSLNRLSPFGLIRRKAERELATRQVAALQVKTSSVETAVMTLSGGNQQKVVLAKWLAMNPRVIILDEPTRGIDVGAKAEIYALMRELARQGAAVLMISSDMEEILHASDRVAVMHEGEISGVLDRADCTEENIMQLAVGRKIACAKPAFVE